MYWFIPVLAYLLIWILSTQIVRILLSLLAGLIWLVWIYTWQGDKRQRKRILHTVIVLMIIWSSSNIFRTQIAEFRFFCLKGYYQTTADSYILMLKDSEDFLFCTEQDSFVLSNWGEIQMQKKNGMISLYFPISDTFFNSYGFVYYFDEQLETADGTFSLANCDFSKKLDNNWAYVKLY